MVPSKSSSVKRCPLTEIVLPGRLVPSINSTEDGREKFKHRFVIGSNPDRCKGLMVLNQQTLQRASTRLMLVFVSIFGFEVWIRDVRQAYLQSTEPLSRAIIINRLFLDFLLDLEQCLQLLKPLYGLFESGDLRHPTLDRHHPQGLRMSPLDTDPSLYHLMIDGTLAGFSGAYVDDILRCRTKEFRRCCLQQI